MKIKPALIVVAIVLAAGLYAQKSKDYNPNLNNVTWNTPGVGFSGSMPVGNGDIGLNVWVEKSGDVLFYIGKTDAFDQNATLLKLATGRIHFEPNPFAGDSSFIQELLTGKGIIRIQEGKKTSISIWVDANNPVIHIETNSDGIASLQLETWRNATNTMQPTQVSDMFKNLNGPDPYPTYNTPDSILTDLTDRIGVLHHNTMFGNNSYEINMKLQGLGDFITETSNPLKDRIFGAVALGEKYIKKDATTLIANGKGKAHAEIFCLTLQPSTPRKWIKAMEELIASTHKTPLTNARAAHEAWWKQFRTRSHVNISAPNTSDSAVVRRLSVAYNLCRFMNASAGRGAVPIKFNGSIFSYGKDGNPDYRRWGGPGFWYQNQRLVYWPMLAQGDFDLMQPWFGMYHNSLELQKKRTLKFFNHAGAFYPETITFWGTEVSSHYGWTPFEERRSPVAECTYLTYYFQNGIEQMLMMYNYFAYTGDTAFARNILLPHADEITKFYDLHYQLDNHGKMHIGPAQALETYQVALNPLPEIAGLQYTLPKLLSLPAKLRSDEMTNRLKTLMTHLPAIPQREVNGRKMLAPAQLFDMEMNVENPELYAVFPYRLFGVGKPDTALAMNAFINRKYKSDVCWNQNVIDAVLLGMVDTARVLILDRAAPDRHSDSRFPAFWNMFNDWSPDVDHGGVLQTAVNYMLLQCEGTEIRLLPCWPTHWNVDFKLYAPDQTIIECAFQNGKITKLIVSPEHRLKDVVMPAFLKKQ